MPNPTADTLHVAPLHAGVAAMVADDGVPVPFDSLPQAFAYDGSGNLTTITVVYNGHTYVQTLTYAGSQLSGSSQLVQTA